MTTPPAELWRPYAIKLRDEAPAGTVLTCAGGGISPFSLERSSVIDIDALGRATPRPWRNLRADTPDPLWDVAKAAGGRLAFNIGVTPTTATIQMMPFIETLELVPGSVPAPFTQTPATYPVDVAATANPEQVTATLKRWMPQAFGESEAAIADAEKRWGVTFTPELRAFYLAASSGDLADQARDDDDSLMRITPLVDERREWPTPTSRARIPQPDWEACATVVYHDPTGRVQDVPASPGWIQIGEDGGGSFWVVDLTPGPGGHVGQVLFIDRDNGGYGACWVADSITDLLQLDDTYPAPTPGDWRGDYELHVDGGTITNVASTIQVVNVSGGQTVDLAPLNGHLVIRSVTITAPVESIETLFTLPGLEWLDMTIGNWAELIGTYHVPPTLKAVHFIGYPDNLTHTAAVLRTLFELWNRGGEVPVPETIQLDL